MENDLWLEVALGGWDPVPQIQLSEAAVWFWLTAFHAAEDFAAAVVA